MKNEKDVTTTDKYVRPTVAGWLTPLLLGPWIGSYAFVSAWSWLGPQYPYVPRMAAFIVGLTVATIYSLTFVIAQALLDVALLTVRLRALPTGKRAWLVAILSPVVPLLVSTLTMKRALWSLNPWVIVATLAAPFCVTLLATRIAFGEKVHANR